MLTVLSAFAAGTTPPRKDIRMTDQYLAKAVKALESMSPAPTDSMKASTYGTVSALTLISIAQSLADIAQSLKQAEPEVTRDSQFPAVPGA
jgi:hypothetical protein